MLQGFIFLRKPSVMLFTIQVYVWKCMVARFDQGCGARAKEF